MTGEILRGGAEKAREAGVVIAGGHTVQDKEPKYGLVVVGFCRPAAACSPRAAPAPATRLVLTKPLGFGVTTTALKREQAEPQDVAEAVGWMKRLNRQAGAAGARVRCCAAPPMSPASACWGTAWRWPRPPACRLHFDFQANPLHQRGAQVRRAVGLSRRRRRQPPVFWRAACSFAPQISEHGANAALRPANQRRAAARRPPSKPGSLPAPRSRIGAADLGGWVRAGRGRD